MPLDWHTNAPLAGFHPMLTPPPGSAAAELLNQSVASTGLSECVPLVLVPVWALNFAESIINTLVPLHALQRSVLLRQEPNASASTEPPPALSGRAPPAPPSLLLPGPFPPGVLLRTELLTTTPHGSKPTSPGSSSCSRHYLPPSYSPSRDSPPRCRAGRTASRETLSPPWERCAHTCYRRIFWCSLRNVFNPRCAPRSAQPLHRSRAPAAGNALSAASRRHASLSAPTQHPLRTRTTTPIC